MESLFSRFSRREGSTKSVPEQNVVSKPKENMKTVRHWKRDKCPSG